MPNDFVHLLYVEQTDNRVNEDTQTGRCRETGGQEDRWRQVDRKIDGDWRKRGQMETGGQEDRTI